MFLQNSLRIVLLFSLCLGSAQVVAQEAHEDNSKRPVIVSPTHPKDSLGETVYERQGDDQKSIPIVPGVLVPPTAIKKVNNVHVTQHLSKDERQDFTMIAVIDEAGDVIDIEIPETAPEKIRDGLRESLQAAKFRPATLDGKPVAILIGTTVHVKYSFF